MGSTGHWCLSHGALHYTGVEVQKEYIDHSSRLLQKYHANAFNLFHLSIEDFFATNTQKYDIVALLGVIYTFVDYYSILKETTDRAREQVIFENMYPDKVSASSKFCGVKFTGAQTINLGSENASLRGRGSLISPRGMRFLMKGFSFKSPDGLLYPKPIESSTDVYNVRGETLPVRYLMRFMRTDTRKISLSEDLQSERRGKRRLWQQ
jgi:hypothetical protein